MSNFSRIKAVDMELSNLNKKQDDPGEILIDMAIGIGVVVGAFVGLWIIYCGILVLSMVINDTI